MATAAGPIAERRPHLVTFGSVEGEQRGARPMASPIQREDPWFWLRDDTRKNEEVLNHLRVENSHTEREMSHLQELREALYREHIGHMKETDTGAAYRHGPWFYYKRTVQGLSYVIHCRKPAPADDPGRRLPDESAEEQVVLDENEVAKGKSQCRVMGVEPSPEHGVLAYSVDFSGDETYSVEFRDLATGQMLPDRLEGVAGGVQWGREGSTVFYCTEDAAKRPWKLWRHKMGTEQSADECLYTEEDELFYFSIEKTTDGRFLVALSGSSETHELRVIDLASASGDAGLVVVQPREFGLRYELDHMDGYFVLWTNMDKAINNRLMRVSTDAVLGGSGGRGVWEHVLEYTDSMMIDAVAALKNHIVIQGREHGLTQIWVIDGSMDPSSMRRLAFPEELYEVRIGTNKEADTQMVCVEYSSLTTPSTVFDVDLRSADAKMQTVWQQSVPGYDGSRYECRRLFAKAPDGREIPMSVSHLKGLFDEKGSGPKPCVLYGYGSYGVCIDPRFDAHILPYLDRGVVFVIAHIRGGGEMGRQWYESEGKYRNKRNTFTDFIACAEHLVEQGVTAPEKLAIEGRSAGGLLVGSVVNMRPDLFRAVIAGVPFVDIMNTMCDPSIPLTTLEWEEWGNPNEWKYFDYMLSYSPYDNVRRMPYPDLLITAGLHDPRVAFWEPAKWASKLRANNTSPTTRVLLKMDLEVGHFSASDRYRFKREKAFDQAFVLDRLGLAAASKM